VPFSKVIYIDQDDFRESPPPKFFRLYPGNEVRLRYAYLVTCVSVEKDQEGNVTVVHCTYDPATRGGNTPDGRKVKSTIHWVSAQHAIPAEVRLYDQLFTVERPDDGDVDSIINPDSLTILENCFVEPALGEAKPGDNFQFERTGYFSVDPDSADDRLVFNRTVGLRDVWGKIEQSGKN